MKEFVPIGLESQWNAPAHIEEYDETNHDEVERLLVGHAVTKVSDDHLVLDDGTTLQLMGNDGGCGCNSGCYNLTELNGVENVITSVEFEDRPDEDDAPCRTCGERYCYEDDHDCRGFYRIFVLAGNDRINLATFAGTDGNGYYGTGYHIFVRRP